MKIIKKIGFILQKSFSKLIRQRVKFSLDLQLSVGLHAFRLLKMCLCVFVFVEKLLK